MILLVLPSFGALSHTASVILNVTLLALITISVVSWVVMRPMKKALHNFEIAKHTIAVREDQILAVLYDFAMTADDETSGHIMRTQQYVRLLANRLKSMAPYAQTLTDEHIEVLVKVAPLHDLGKVNIPDHILGKKTPFSDIEKEFMYSHTMIGESILTSFQSEGHEMELIATAIKVAGSHHEKWDGSGYPRNLQGEDIPIEARIMSVADVFDALISRRSYKDGWSIDEAYSEIINGSGTAFDPLVVQAFITERKAFEAIASKG